jgi:hypothetical protein
MPELLARLDSLLRSATRMGVPAFFALGTSNSICSSDSVRRGPHDVTLSTRELDLLAFFMTAPEQVHEKSQDPSRGLGRRREPKTLTCSRFIPTTCVTSSNKMASDACPAHRPWRGLRPLDAGSLDLSDSYADTISNRSMPIARGRSLALVIALFGRCCDSNCAGPLPRLP